jgi:hypothetical protein
VPAATLAPARAPASASSPRPAGGAATDGDSFVLGESEEELQPAASDDDIEAETGLFDDRQKQYLLGRTVTKAISDNKGNVLAEQGDKITEKIINSAREAGKMVHLVMNNRA